MAKDRNNVRIYGDDASGVYAGPKGTTGPTTLAAPAVGFVEAGWLGEDGIDYTQAVEKTEFFAHQGGALIKVK
jgi:hypothetical protein